MICPHCGKTIIPDFRLLAPGVWSVNDLLRLATLLKAANMTLGDLLDEMHAAAALAEPKGC